MMGTSSDIQKTLKMTEYFILIILNTHAKNISYTVRNSISYRPSVCKFELVEPISLEVVLSRTLYK